MTDISHIVQRGNDEGEDPISVKQRVDEALRRLVEGRPGDADEEIDLPSPRAEVAKWLTEYPRPSGPAREPPDEAVEAHAGNAVPETVDLVEQHHAAARQSIPRHAPSSPRCTSTRPRPPPSDLAAQAAKAIPHLEFLDQREQKVPTYAMELAKRYAALNDLAKATAKAERATQIDPFNPRPRELAAAIAIRAKDWPAAERHITALTLIVPTLDLHKKRLEALKKLHGKDQPDTDSRGYHSL